MTEAERLSIYYESETCAYLSKETPWTWSRFSQTAESQHSCADGFLLHRAELTLDAMFEVKCRDMSPDDFKYSFKSEWLVSYQKMEACRLITMRLKVPFIMTLRLLNGNLVLVQQIWDSNGNLNTGIRLAQTTTQKNVNGGIASRPNAYIDMRDADVFAM
jgi:hypothetical protein